MMKQITKSIAVALMALGLLGTGVIPTLAQGRERHPKIRQAIRALDAAQDYMRDAAHDFCGHKAKAMEATRIAKDELRLALESDRAAVDGLHSSPASFETADFEFVSVVEPGAERHPMIKRAIKALEDAMVYMRQADHDFHGHKKSAMEATSAAITQLREALACDRY